MWPYPVSILSKTSIMTQKLPLINLPSIRTKAKVVKSLVPEPEIHPVGWTRAAQPGFGKIYDKKPFKMSCEKGKEYRWCACGHSKSQPICDSLCQNTHYKITLKSVRFLAPETKDYWFCNCKQTLKRPFCDGSHRKEEVIAAVKV